MGADDVIIKMKIGVRKVYKEFGDEEEEVVVTAIQKINETAA
jgi:hypothetical protein